MNQTGYIGWIKFMGDNHELPPSFNGILWDLAVAWDSATGWL